MKEGSGVGAPGFVSGLSTLSPATFLVNKGKSAIISFARDKGDGFAAGTKQVRNLCDALRVLKINLTNLSRTCLVLSSISQFRRINRKNGSQKKKWRGLSQSIAR